jgi:hypothetical protein
MANIKKDTVIPTVSIVKRRSKFSGQNFDSESNTIYINYDLFVLDSNNVEVYKYGQTTVVIPQSRFNEPAVAAFIAAGTTLITNEAP